MNVKNPQTRDLNTLLCENNITLDSAQIALLESYTALLLRWNETHNLSGARTIEGMHENIVDSLCPLHFLQSFKSALDIGSGGGFPAIPLSIARQNATFSLLEPRAKRFSFLQNVICELGLKNVSVYKARLESLNALFPNSPLQVDLITSRAVMPASKLMKMARGFLSKNGYFLLFKGSQFGANLKQEIPNASQNECFTRNDRIYFYTKNSFDF
ncbi:16S rRNA (guanine(527)-N(7))-methyltransferase RsmG [Helicobacter sp. MIT 99-10781]|uniref:16S rRNA (guanine(527)-N(7))-methyltransferase RsmG n=1 Tax=Helicobacter sp. MIT 99-10781 TaxID=1332285 RepID=UPI000E1FB962|nr:16S rRNA (guanine(527)-N(7))-methyltransferase RsmG [Helicobacter sp. MIT 99-10781]RDU55233.1 16S rRNA (guanine(527)-N(7))-methyltransferase RsmG [Helicobacter sp. MIT 99-10781]